MVTVVCQNAPYGQVLLLPSQPQVRPAADDDFDLNLLSLERNSQDPEECGWTTEKNGLLPENVLLPIHQELIDLC